MKVYVTVAGRDFTVELDGDRAMVSGENDDRLEVRIASPDASTALSEGAEALVVPVCSDGGLPESFPLHVAFWGHAGGPAPEKTLRLVVRGHPVDATFETERDRLKGRLSVAPRTPGKVSIRSPLPGVIRQVFLFPGNEVRAGTPIMTLEAMKMENEIRAETDGLLEALHVEEGQVVNAGDRLCEIRMTPD